MFGWFLVVAGTLVPAFFVLLYSMQWGKQKSEEWLTSFLLSNFESMLFVDPVMVMCFAFVLACLFRKSKGEANVDMDNVVQNYKKLTGEDKNDYMSSTIAILKKIKDEYLSYKSNPRNVSMPMNQKEMKKAAKQRRLELNLIKCILDFILTTLLMFIVCVIAFANRDDMSYYHRQELMRHFVSPAHLPTFESIITQKDMFNWIKYTMIPNLFPETDINGDALHWYYRTFMTGLNNYRLGPPRLRQLRTHAGFCNIPYFGNNTCYGGYNLLDEETEGYCIGWQSKPCSMVQQTFNITVDAWSFTSALDIWGLPLTGFYTTYGGGGYISPFDVNKNVSVDIVEELVKNLWVDRQTRVVLFEFTLFSPETNMFIYNVFMVEFPQTGGAFKTYWIYPIKLYNHVGPNGMFALVCEVIFVIYLLVLFFKICLRIYQQRLKYFGQFWQSYECVLFLLGGSTCVIYFIRSGFTDSTISKYRSDFKRFVNFSHIVLWDEILGVLLAIIVFMSTIRILEVFATLKKVSSIVKVFEQCGKDLFWYGATFVYILLGFAFFGWFLFGPYLLSYMSIYKCLTTLCLSMIGKSTFTEIDETNPILAKICFTFYIIAVVFFILSIFLSILGASIDNVVDNKTEDTHKDIIKYMMAKFTKMFNKSGNKEKHVNVPLVREEVKQPTLYKLYNMENKGTHKKSYCKPGGRK
ncbi:polycystin-2-like [Dreissena polymorpha]|uniref:polycystin-2-like n=1 Tax=Dreissena polymorpha TaxID=45954 RepID=UPI0022642CDA|nr:polycystin-2-like [Dreissena polymorpha]